MSYAQQNPVEESWELDSADVKTIDGILAAMYDVISGEAGPRNWERFRALSRPETQFNAFGIDREGNESYHPGTRDGYEERAGKMFLKTGFFEQEIGRKVIQYRNMAHVFSAYASRLEPDGKVIQRGINSFQLIWENGRWWVVNILWTPETDEDPIPEEMLF